MFFRISLKIFALKLPLDICYIMFQIFYIGPSFLPRSNVTLLKNAETAKVADQRHKNQLANFSSKGFNY